MSRSPALKPICVLHAIALTITLLILAGYPQTSSGSLTQFLASWLPQRHPPTLE